MKKINGKSYLLIGLTLLLIGIFTLIGSVSLFKSVADLVLIIMVLITIKDLFSFILNKPKINFNLFIKILTFLLALLSFIFDEYSIAIVPIIFSIYCLLNSTVDFINFVIIKLNKLKGGYEHLFNSLIYLSIGITILFSPIMHLDVMLNILGIYSILLGITFIFDHFEINHYFKIRICLPSIVEAFIPLSVLQHINKVINDDGEVKYVEKKNEEKTDLEIFIHVTENGFGRLGHMDICYNNEVISYGNYDISSYRFHDLFGTGVVFTTTNREKYIKFCIEDSKKTLFSFGLKLNKKEKEQIENNIQKIKENLKVWYPPYVAEKRKRFFVSKKKYKDYSSRLFRATHAKFYKFKYGKYKIYFVLGNNCVLLANKIIGKTLKNKFKFYGIMTPGTYYDYLEREYMKKKSIVISKKIYSKSNIDNIT